MSLQHQVEWKYVLACSFSSQKKASQQEKEHQSLLRSNHLLGIWNCITSTVINVFLDRLFFCDNLKHDTQRQDEKKEPQGGFPLVLDQ